jgi:uncharacterized protein (TIGR02118 family)
MVKLIAFFKRKPGMDKEDFQRYWRTGHADLAVKLAGMQRYVQCATILSAYRKGQEPVWDGVAETWFEDTQTIKAMAKTNEYKALRADEYNFIDVPTMGWMYCQEHVIKDGPIPEIYLKSMVFVKRRPEWDVDSFQKYWLEVHGPLGAAVPGSLRYVQNHTWRSFYDSGKSPIYDGLAQVWFKDTQQIREATNSPEHARDLEDADKFMIVSEAPFLITKEQVIVP